ncbi:MAG: DNA cytosine methyltransferase [Candidatus Fonsibacter sp.]
MLNDISRRPPEQLPDHDLCGAGFPFQPFSPMGSRQGLADKLGAWAFYFNSYLPR